MKNLFITIFLLLGVNVAYPQQLHKEYDILLGKYVKKGLVDYEGLKNETGLDKYLSILSQTNPDTLKTKNAKEAFWINAYNAFTLKVVAENYPIESITDLNFGGMIISHLLGKTVWDKDFITINNKRYSLNDIEHEMLRKKFSDPQIHFALVCASLSCPNLRPEAYTSDKLDRQLEEQGRFFINNPKINRFDLKNKVAHISKIFDWYGDDFGENNNQILLFISNYLNDPEIAKSIREKTSGWDIEFLPYNWCLNVKGAKWSNEGCMVGEN